LTDGSRWVLKNQFSIEIPDGIFIYVYIVGFAIFYSLALEKFKRGEWSGRDKM
jgi:hypothetical protein